jgi:uncharacterized protein (DUF983 family)
MAQAETQLLPEKAIVLWRGFRGACPACGKGKLFRSYLFQNESCSVCHKDYSDIHADDGPAWFVMLITGAIVVPVAVPLAIHDVMPDWAVFALLVFLTFAVALLLLPRVKGIFIAVLWRLKTLKEAMPDA